LPVIRDIPLKLDVNEVIRQVGIANDAELRPKMESLIAELLSNDAADCLPAPAIAYELHAITEIQNRR
jgi:hypothetical protein